MQSNCPRLLSPPSTPALCHSSMTAWPLQSHSCSWVAEEAAGRRVFQTTPPLPKQGAGVTDLEMHPRTLTARTNCRAWSHKETWSLASPCSGPHSSASNQQSVLLYQGTTDVTWKMCSFPPLRRPPQSHEKKWVGPQTLAFSLPKEQNQ